MQVWDLLAPGGKQELELAKSIGGFDIPELTQIGDRPALQTSSPICLHPAADRASCGRAQADWTQSVTCCRLTSAQASLFAQGGCA